MVELADNTGAVQERVRYSAYGKAWVTRDGDANQSGAIDGADLGLLMGAWGSSYGDANFNPDVDLNNDGTVNGADMGILLGAWGSYDTSASGFGNTVMYAGYLYDAAVGLHLARFRWYDADRGCWVTRDPVGYSAGSMSLFQYVESSPTKWADSFGLATIKDQVDGWLEGFRDTLHPNEQQRLNPRTSFCRALGYSLLGDCAQKSNCQSSSEQKSERRKCAENILNKVAQCLAAKNLNSNKNHLTPEIVAVLRPSTNKTDCYVNCGSLLSGGAEHSCFTWCDMKFKDGKLSTPGVPNTPIGLFYDTIKGIIDALKSSYPDPIDYTDRLIL